MRISLIRHNLQKIGVPMLIFRHEGKEDLILTSFKE